MFFYLHCFITCVSSLSCLPAFCLSPLLIDSSTHVHSDSFSSYPPRRSVLCMPLFPNCRQNPGDSGSNKYTYSSF
ncbi:hypothetical protein C8R41DRAFT_805051 [Lentinula lateritia]|uniref:Secreted protein n=1 Tax=Lentinula lateritia TaxID=40482 RepID=A0ABQ8W2K8_9AGAR|nr:hypothetical protein C8R41DRAFT_805051 [Lentinula lateritia]